MKTTVFVNTNITDSIGEDRPAGLCNFNHRYGINTHLILVMIGFNKKYFREVYMRKKVLTVAMTFAIVISTLGIGAVSAEAAYSKTHYGNGLDGHISNEMQMANWSNGDMFGCKWEPGNISFNNGVMDMKIDKSGNQYTGAEYRTKEYFGYGFYQVSMKPIKNDGVVSSFFTYTGPSDGTPWDEIDIEFLGKDTTHVQFNYYVNGRGGHEKWYNLGFDASKSYHTYGFNWYEGGITWYVDGNPVYTVTSATDAIPSHPSKIMMNVWNGVGVDDWLNHYNGKTPLHAYYDWFAWDAPSGGSSSGSSSGSDNNSSSSSSGASLFDSKKTYKIINYNSGLAVDVDHGYRSNGANILQYAYKSSTNQKWSIEKQSNGYYIVKNIATGKVLTVQDFADWDGANVHQWEYVGNDNQEWQIVPARNNTYKLINRHSGKALNVAYASKDSVANIEQYKDVDGDAELWWIDIAN